ncbi:hypothetical protein JL720_10191 [Aureococcus anophagefferens]|nr:hypothetical protein JL720_10191 [Aureococcus anophagefferens]
MFLVQMSLDTKREEIRKLEEKAQMKEEALKKSEQMLEEDAIRRPFLKENDKKAHEAIKKAEKETKLKTDKVQEIKRLNQQIQMLEEQNLFLIQNSQETEKALEELKQNFEATKEQMDGKTALLKQNIDELELQIGAEENKAAQLRGRLQARAGETQGRQEKLLAQLHEKVRDVYQKCGFDVGSKPSTLFMLSELEARLEQLLDHIETMSEGIMKEEKDKEKKRRERKRQEQQALGTRSRRSATANPSPALCTGSAGAA